jgi:hypothetical protein
MGNNRDMDGKQTPEMPEAATPTESEIRGAKIALIKKMRGCTAGGPSGTDMLLEDRRREYEEELAKNGW